MYALTSMIYHTPIVRYTSLSIPLSIPLFPIHLSRVLQLYSVVYLYSLPHPYRILSYPYSLPHPYLMSYPYSLSYPYRMSYPVSPCQDGKEVISDVMNLQQVYSANLLVLTDEVYNIVTVSVPRTTHTLTNAYRIYCRDISLDS